MKEDTSNRDRQAERRTSKRGTADERTRSGNHNPDLYPLNDLDDYKVASDDPDVRGWDVISGDNERVGKVDGLIVDTKRMKVRYLVIDMEDKYLSDHADEDDYHLLVPIGAARLHEDKNDVIVSNITTENLAHYPTYHGDRITRDHEQSIRRFYEGGGGAAAATTTTTSSTTTSPSKPDTEHETIRDAHTGKIYERQEDEQHESRQDSSSASGSGSRSEVDSNSRNRVDVVSGTSGDQHAKNKDDRGGETAHGSGQMSELPEEDRTKDRTKASSNTIRGDRSAEDRRPDNKTNFGSLNHTSANDVKDRMTTSGISSSRTSNLENKDLEQGPTSKGRGGSASDTPEEERVRIHDTDPNVENPKGSGDKDDYNSTSNLNRSTSKGDDAKRGSNVGNMENRDRVQGMQDRSRMSSPEFTERTSTPGDSGQPDKYPEGKRPVNKKDLEHSSDELPDDRYDPENDEFYTHDHFDEDRFYGDRRKKDK